MTVLSAPRSPVVLRAGGDMSPADRASLTGLLLERGLEVSCRKDHGIAGDPTERVSP